MGYKCKYGNNEEEEEEPEWNNPKVHIIRGGLCLSLVRIGWCRRSMAMKEGTIPILTVAGLSLGILKRSRN